MAERSEHLGSSVPPESGNGAHPGRNLRFLDGAAVVLRRWRQILLTTAGTILVALALTLLRPAPYVASTVLVPFSETQSRTQLALGRLPTGVANLIGVSNPSNDRLITAILRSRSLADSMVRRVSAGPKGEAEVREILDDGTRTQRNPDGSILIQVRASDPQLAARMANTFPVLVNEILARIGREGASRKQEFLDGQLSAARERLVQSEQRVLDFQQQRETPDLPEQARRTLEAAAELQASIYEKEVQVAQLRRVATPDNPELRAAVAELAARRAQLRRLTAGGGAGSPVFVPMGEGPALKVAATRLLREFEKDEKVYEALTAALAEAQIDANNNLPVLSVLDPAEVPESSSRSIPVTLALAAAFGLILGVAAAFASDAAHRVERSPENEPFFSAWDEFKGDLSRLTPARGGRAEIRNEK